MSEEMKDSGLEFNLPKKKSSVIKVIGVGGGGGNAVNHMQFLGIKSIDYIVCNTDSQALEHSDVSNKIQLGASLTEGLGAGANPNVGKEAALESLEEIKNILENNTKMLFITAGMGGGTGTGAAPVIAKLSKEMGLLTVGIVTMPFPFEGMIRMKAAEAGLKELKQHVDSLIVIKNEKLREVYGNLGYKKGFKMADSVLSTAVKVIAEVITHHYLANIDLQDARKVLANSGTAIMGSASADGEKRAIEAVTGALDSPLLNDNHIKGAQNVLLLIVSGDDDHEITVDEIAEISEYIQKEAGGDTNIILGIGEDKALDKKISVTVIATGFERDNNPVKVKSGPATIKIPLDANIEEAQIEPPKVDPMTTPIEKTLKQTPPVEVSRQTDLFTAVEEAETEQREGELKKSLESENVSELKEGEDENDNLYPSEFENKNNPNEIIFEVTKDINRTASVEEEISSIANAEDEDCETDKAEKIEEIPETTFVLEDQEEEIYPAELIELGSETRDTEKDKDEKAESTFALEEKEEVKISEILQAVGAVKEIEESEKEAEEKTDLVIEESKADEVSIDSTLLKNGENSSEDKLGFELDTDAFTFTEEPVDEEDKPQTKEPIEESVLDPLNFSIAEINEIKNGTQTEEVSAEEDNVGEVEKLESIEATSEQPVKHSLEDLQALEEILGVKSHTSTKKEISVTTPEEEEEDESLQFKVKTIRPKKVEKTVEEESPVDDKIEIANFKLKSDRVLRLKNFNYQFRNTDTDKKEPAYKRQGLEIQNKGISDEINLSRMSINGEGKEANIHSSNSFLHDNVD